MKRAALLLAVAAFIASGMTLADIVTKRIRGAERAEEMAARIESTYRSRESAYRPWTQVRVPVDGGVLCQMRGTGRFVDGGEVVEVECWR